MFLSENEFDESGAPSHALLLIISVTPKFEMRSEKSSAMFGGNKVVTACTAKVLDRTSVASSSDCIFH